ncbi:hypothetical protein [Streptomyces sp. NBC_01276]|uniref:hypothetical protein n=1 Tax=Streptomyces sp. NBC_01276 TaxID=2903808 RepID=UPI002F9069B5
MSEATESVDAQALRVERWRALLSGADGKGVKGEAMRGSGAVNLLTGVWLHAAARAEQGLELTELELSILAPVQGVLSEEEVGAVGRVYREERGGDGLAAVLPQAVTSRSLSQGFSLEEYKAALTELLPQIAAMPNVAVVDRAKLAAGENVDSPEFTAALARHRYGVTGFTAPSDGDAAVGTQENTRPFYAVLEWDRFICIEPAGDQGGGRDEIYWTASANTQGYGATSRTGEAGGVTRGNTYWIHGDHQTGDKAFFRTAFNGCGSVVITCWEADQSNAEWYTELGKALQTVVDQLQASADFSGMVPGLDLYGHLHSALSFFTTFWEALRNKDDLVLSRAFAFGRADLKAMDDLPEVHWRFDATSRGMGDFDLVIRYTGSDPDHTPPRPWNPSLLVHSTDGYGWDHFAYLPEAEASSKPALAAFDGKLYCMVRRDSDLEYATSDGSTWTDFTKVSYPVYGTAPALAAFDGKLYCAVNVSGGMQYASFDGATWTPFTLLGNANGYGLPPALAAFDGKLYCAFKDGQGYPSLKAFDGRSWYYVTTYGRADSRSAALASFENRMHWVVSNDRALEHRSFAYGHWNSHPVIEDSDQPLSEPALAAFNGKLYVTYTKSDRRGNGIVRCSVLNNGRWYPVDKFPQHLSTSAPQHRCTRCLQRPAVLRAGRIARLRGGKVPSRSAGLTAGAPARAGLRGGRNGPPGPYGPGDPFSAVRRVSNVHANLFDRNACGRIG